MDKNQDLKNKINKTPREDGLHGAGARMCSRTRASRNGKIPSVRGKASGEDGKALSPALIG